MEAGKAFLFSVAALLVTAGCLGIGSEEGEEGDPSPGDGTPPDRSPSTMNATSSTYGSLSTDDAWEPTVTAGPNGAIYVTGASSDLIHVQDGEGGDWEIRPVPPAPPESRNIEQSDGLVSVDDEGRLWYTALLPSQVGPVSDPTRGGVQIAVSEDGGQTWSANHYVGPLDFPWNADRQWITFGPEGTAYVVWKAYQGTIQQQQDPHLVAVTVSADGSSLSAPVNVTPVLPSSTSLIGGQPSTGSDGTLIVPYLSIDHSSSAEGNDPTRNGSLHISRSTNGAESFEQIEVWDPPDGDPGTSLPISAVGDHDRFHLAWNGPGDQVVHASSEDGGRTWTAPTSVASLDEQNSREAPWISVDEGISRIAGFGPPQDGQVPLDLTAFPENATPTQNRSDTVRVAEPTAGGGSAPASTDFAHLTNLPSGETVVVWASPSDVTAGRPGGEIDLAKVRVSQG